MKVYNVRLIKVNGKFQFADGFMHRLANKKNCKEWVDASKTDRRKLKEALEK